MVREKDASPVEGNGVEDPFAMLEAEQMKEKSAASSKPKSEVNRKVSNTTVSAPPRTGRPRQSDASSDSDSEASEDERWAREREARRKRALEQIDKEYENKAKQRAVLEKTAEEKAKVQEAALQAGFTPLERYILRSGEIAEKYKVDDLKIKEKLENKHRSNAEESESRAP
ncbi:hypothetical protein FOZ60_011390 [Perkinsus olseni]|uniref:Uncharacterized protein n=1 Tax=Perkinsus olseni TaxID=32597 RepID=A0A7J6NDC9_PEROL|nr:hypothetical protein FOZ60_011390 [Perkinsus olseni]